MPKGRQKSDMECPRCLARGGAWVGTSRVSADGRARLRGYTCSLCGGRFRTREAVVSQELNQVYVRKPASGSSADDSYEPFRLAVIGDQLRRKLVKVLTQADRDRIVAQTEHNLEQRLGELAVSIPAPVARKRRLARNTFSIDAEAIRQTIDDVLQRSGQELDDQEDRRRHQSAHVLYALATQGQRWNVQEFVIWLQKNYRFERLRLGRALATTTVSWHPPALTLPTTPMTVVKNFRPPTPRALMNVNGGTVALAPVEEEGHSVGSEEEHALVRRPTQDFRVDKMRRTIDDVLSGRRNPRACRGGHHSMGVVEPCGTASCALLPDLRAGGRLPPKGRPHCLSAVGHGGQGVDHRSVASGGTRSPGLPKH